MFALHLSNQKSSVQTVWVNACNVRFAFFANVLCTFGTNTDFSSAKRFSRVVFGAL